MVYVLAAEPVPWDTQSLTGYRPSPKECLPTVTLQKMISARLGVQ